MNENSNDIKSSAIIASDQEEVSSITVTKEHAERSLIINKLKMMINQGMRYTDDEMQALATYAVAQRLDPLAGECYLLKGRDNVIVGCMTGIKGLRRKAREQLKQGDSYTVQFNPVRDALPEGATIGYECQLRVTSDIADYLSQMKLAKELDLSGDQISNIIGRPPVWSGYGYYYGAEKNIYKDKAFDPRSRARKRAEAQALRLRFHLPFDFVDDFRQGTEEVKIIGAGSDIIDGEMIDQDDQGASVDAEYGEAQINGVSRPYDPQTLKQKLQERIEYYESNGQGLSNDQVISMIAPNLEMCFAGDSRSKEIRHDVMFWLIGKISVKELTPAEALALNKWIDAKPDSGNQWIPNKLSCDEAHRVYQEQLRDNGQMSFDDQVDELYGPKTDDK